MINLRDSTKMRKLLYILLILGVYVTAHAQDDLQKADLYFSKTYYSDAIPLYESLLPQKKNSKIIRNLADSYYHTFNMQAAAKWYEYLSTNYAEGLTAEDYFKYNQSLKAIGKFNKADDVLNYYFSSLHDTIAISKVDFNRKYISNIAAIGERFDIRNLALNTTSSEFGAAEVDSVLIYSAARKKTKTLPKLYRWNNQSYLDFYSHPVSKLQISDTLSVPLSNKINSKLHEGTFTITKDRKTLYFTRNSKQKTEEEHISHLKIYKAEWVNNAWGNIIELPFNGTNFSTEHPALSADENRLYFSSDRDGGYGSFDLYYVTIQQDGFYSNPINLGSTINTPKKEQFPFIAKNGDLYFSSNGHAGFGLLDVFISKPQNDGYGTPDNIGLPVNSGYDDFSFALNKDSTTGYFASNRPNGKGSDDIYSFMETKPLIIEDCVQFIAGTITDITTKAILSNAKISIKNETNDRMEIIFSAEDGSFTFTATCSNSYHLKAAKDGYESSSIQLVTDDERKTSKDGSIALLSLQEIEKQKAIAIKNERLAAQKKSIAEANRKKIEEKKATEKRLKEEAENKEKQHLAQIAAKKIRDKKIEEVIQKESDIVRDKDRIIIKTEEIHFDYSLWYLRREARTRLDRVISIMKAQPGMVLEIGTHTDIRGNNEYNRDLSQKRADAAKAYFVKNGIDNKRVIAKGYGESKPIVICETEESCSEEDHEWNRRCELVVVKWE